MHIMEASKQWATRPADQRFWDLEELQSAVDEVRANSAIGVTPESGLRVEADEGALRIVSDMGNRAEISHWAFGQLATRAGAPAGYLRELPATLAAQNINHGLRAHQREGRDAHMLIYRNGGNLVRSLATDKFAPIWNSEIVEQLRNLPGDWQTPPARPAHNGTDERTRIATAADARLSISGGLGVKEGDVIAPAGIYASPEDMFVFLIDPTKVIRDGSPDGLQRGVIVQNAEVSGKLRFRMMTFFHRGVCGNHIVWNASELQEVAIRHVGTAADRAFAQIAVTVRRYAEGSATEDEARIQSARTRYIAASQEDVISALFKRHILPRAQLEEAWVAAESNPVDGDPKTFWGFAQGITRISQDLPNADARTAVDQAAGRVLSMAF